MTDMTTITKLKRMTPFPPLIIRALGVGGGKIGKMIWLYTQKKIFGNTNFIRSYIKSFHEDNHEG